MLDVIRRVIWFCLFGRFRLALPRNLPRYLEDRLARKDFGCRAAPLATDDALKIDEEEPALRRRHIPLGI